MNRTGSMAWCLGLAAVAVSQLLLVTALIVLPQWRARQSARRGIVTFFVAGDSSIRIWNRPIDSAVMPSLIRRAEQLDSSTRIRVVLSPGVPWGVVQDLVSLLDETALDVELQLPAAALLSCAPSPFPWELLLQFMGS